MELGSSLYVLTESYGARLLFQGLLWKQMHTNGVIWAPSWHFHHFIYCTQTIALQTLWKYSLFK